MISIAGVDPRSPEAGQLVAELMAELSVLYPELIDDAHRVVNLADFLAPRHAFVIASIDGKSVGCGALRPMDETDAGEIKRMYVAPSVRSRGVGRAILVELERLAAEFGYRVLRLETGIRQPAAIALYEKFGFTRIPCYGKFATDPISVCFEKPVSPR